MLNSGRSDALVFFCSEFDESENNLEPRSKFLVQPFTEPQDCEA